MLYIVIADMTEPESQELTQIFNLIAKRANLMKAVAFNKHITNHNIYCATQEIKLLRRIQKIATELSLPVYPVMIFAQIQMDLSKYIEQYWLDHWNKSDNQNHDNDFSLKQLRLTIKEIDHQLYSAIKQAVPILKNFSLATIMPLFDQAMTKVPGMPLSPNYGHMVLYALTAIAVTTQ